jgi:hypothetical protein
MCLGLPEEGVGHRHAGIEGRYLAGGTAQVPSF